MRVPLLCAVFGISCLSSEASSSSTQRDWFPRRSKINETEANTTTRTDKKEQRRSFFRRPVANESSTSLADIKNSTTSHNSTSATDSNKTNSTTEVEPQQTQHHTIIASPFMFPPPPPHQQQGMVVVRGSPAPAAPATSAILMASVASVLSAALRIWFFTSLTRWFTDSDLKTLVKPTQHFMWERLNDRYSKDTVALATAIQAPPMNISERRWKRQMKREAAKERRYQSTQTSASESSSPTTTTTTDFDKTVVVVDMRAGPSGEFDLLHLSDVITFILSQHRQGAFGTINGTSKELEVVLLVESPGGAVAHFGLAAAQIGRLRNEEGIHSTIIADKIIASGGYMVACQANKLIAAPFAIVGSIGVIRESYSINKLLQNYGIEPVSLKAGEDKAPLTLLSEVTKKDIEKTQESLDKMHIAFKELVVEGRPMLADSFEEVCQGAIYLGQEARMLKLIDEVMTSEEYILEQIQARYRVLKLHRVPMFAKHRRLLFHDVNPLDFIRENGSEWLASQDIPQLISKGLQTTTVLRFIHHLLRPREG